MFDTRFLAFLVRAAVSTTTIALSLACSSSTGTPDGSSSSGDADAPTSEPPDAAAATRDAAAAPDGDGGADATAPAAAPVTGTLAGKPFEAKSGFARVDGDGTVSLLFSSDDDLCAAAGAMRLRPGESLVQIYGLKGTAPGPFTTASPLPDIKYVAIASGCPTGAHPVPDHVAGSGRAEAMPPKVTLTVLDPSSAAGTIDITFDDGSRIAGSFAVPRCGSVLTELVTCE